MFRLTARYRCHFWTAPCRPSPPVYVEVNKTEAEPRQVFEALMLDSDQTDSWKQSGFVSQLPTGQLKNLRKDKKAEHIRGGRQGQSQWACSKLQEVCRSHYLFLSASWAEHWPDIVTNGGENSLLCEEWRVSRWTVAFTEIQQDRSGGMTKKGVGSRKEGGSNYDEREWTKNCFYSQRTEEILSSLF